MKNFKKVLASILAVTTLGSLVAVPLNASAIYTVNLDTGEVLDYGALYGDDADLPDSSLTVVGDTTIDESSVVVVVTAPCIGDSDSETTIGDSDGGNDDSGSGIGVSTVTCLQGDVNLDGVINGLDLVLLKKYILGLV